MTKEKSDNDFSNEIADENPVLPVVVPGKARFAPYIPPPNPLLHTWQELHRISSQPDRLVAVKAADVPLIEAARPLLDALTHASDHFKIAKRIAAEEVDAFHRQLLREVVAFQSVCHDAGIGDSEVLCASYMLCTALDEATAIALSSDDETPGPGAWTDRPLSVHFHGDNKGGKNVFVLLGWLVARPEEHIDLLELVLYLLALGFQGIYRNAMGGRSNLDNIRRRVHGMVSACRGELKSARLQRIERLLREL